MDKNNFERPKLRRAKGWQYGLGKISQGEMKRPAGTFVCSHFSLIFGEGKGEEGRRGERKCRRLAELRPAKEGTKSKD